VIPRRTINCCNTASAYHGRRRKCKFYGHLPFAPQIRSTMRSQLGEGHRPWFKLVPLTRTGKRSIGATTWILWILTSVRFLSFQRADALVIPGHNVRVLGIRAPKLGALPETCNLERRETWRYFRWDILQPFCQFPAGLRYYVSSFVWAFLFKRERRKVCKSRNRNRHSIESARSRSALRDTTRENS